MLRAQGDTDLSRLVHHAIHSADAATIVEFAPLVGKQSAAAGAHRQALVFFAAALRYADLITPRALADLLYDYAWELYNAHRFGEAVEAGTRAVHLFSELAERTAEAEALVRLSRYLFMQGLPDQAHARADEAVELSIDCPDAMVDALAAQGALLALDDRADEAVEVLRRAEHEAARSGRDDLVALSLNYASLARRDLSAAERVELLREAWRSPIAVVEPVQLQVVCYQLWENLKNRHTGAITMQDLEQSGDVDTALASFYEEAIASVLHDRRVGGASEIAVRNWFDQQLMTEAGTRGMVYRGETHTAGLPNGIVKLIEDRYLLRSETRSAGVWYELVHDRFVEPIVQANRAWWAQQRPLMRDAQAWQEANRDKGKLYLGQQLQEALASVAQSAPEPVIAAFLNASEAEQQALEEQEAARQRELEATRQLAAAREQTATALRRRARILVGVMVAALIAAVAAVWFGIRAEQAKAEAEQEKNRAQKTQEEALRGQSLFLADLARQQNEQGQYTLAALLALEALPKSMDAPNRPYVPEAEPQLYTAVINLREKWIFAGHQGVGGAGGLQPRWALGGHRLLRIGRRGCGMPPAARCGPPSPATRGRCGRRPSAPMGARW